MNEPWALQFERFRLLRGMRMHRAGVALELLDHGVAERSLGQHALDRLFKRAAGKALLHLPEGDGANAARIAAMAVIELLVDLVARDLDLVDVGDDDEVTGVDVRRENGLVLAAQTMRDRAGEPSKHLVIGIDKVPIARKVTGFGGVGFHRKCRSESIFAKSLMIMHCRNRCQTKTLDGERPR